MNPQAIFLNIRFNPNTIREELNTDSVIFFESIQSYLEKVGQGDYLYLRQDEYDNLEETHRKVLEEHAVIPVPLDEKTVSLIEQQADMPVAEKNNDGSPSPQNTPSDDSGNKTEAAQNSKDEETVATPENHNKGSLKDPNKHDHKKSIPGLNHKIEVTAESVSKRIKVAKQREPYQPSEVGYLLTITSAFGGGGKTTISYYAAQCLSMAFKYTKNESAKVILIEADYGNPKLQNRLGIPENKDLSVLANFLEKAQSGEIPEKDIPDYAAQILEEIIFTDPQSGINIIACPYDKSRANPAFLREALKKAVLWAQRSMGWTVVLDADTVGLAEGLELDLMEMSNRIIVISNTVDPRVQEKRKFLFWKKTVIDTSNPNERSHIDDAVVMIHGFTEPIEKNGFGIPGDRIRVFFNETSAEELKSKVTDKEPAIFPKNMVIGYLPFIPEIEKGWAGDLNRNKQRAIDTFQLITQALLRATGFLELDQILKATRNS